MRLFSSDSQRPYAVVVGAACGIGYQLARCCAEQGFDLLITGDSPDVEDAAGALRELGAAVSSVQANPSTLQGVEQIHIANRGRPIDMLLVHAGRSGWSGSTAHELSQAVDNHITGTLYLLHKLGGDLRAHGQGRVLVTGSLPGFVPAFADSFSLGLHSQLKDCGASIICLVPGAGENGFFVRTDRVDTQVLYVKQDDPTAVAAAGFEALLREQGDEPHADAAPWGAQRLHAAQSAPRYARGAARAEMV